MIAINQCILYFTSAALVLNFIINNTSQLPMVYFGGEVRCTIIFTLIVVQLAYTNVGSCGMAIMRVLYIKNSIWLKDTFGEWNMCYLLLTMGFIYTCINCAFVALYSMINIPACYGYSTEFSSILDDFQT